MEPDYSTKPADIIGYCFGYACPSGHVHNTFDKLDMNDLHLWHVCQQCGEVSRVCTVKRIAEAQWKPYCTKEVMHKVTFLITRTFEHRWEQVTFIGFGRGSRVTWTQTEFIRFVGAIDREG